MDVARVQDRGKSTLIPSSEEKKHGSEVSVESHPKCPTLHYVREAESEEQTSRFRSSVLTLLYLSNERTDIQSTVRLL